MSQRMIPLHIADQAVAACNKEIEQLKAELAKSEEHNGALCERMQDLNSEVFTASCTNARLHSQFANSEQENARLKAEVERLRKAGDAMADALSPFRVKPFPGPYLCDLQKGWEAAKEGKQS